MDGFRRNGKRLSKIFLFLGIALFSTTLLAFNPEAIKSQLPSSTQPGIISNTLTAPTLTRPRSLPALATPQQKAQSLGPEAEKVKFKLMRVILEGNKAYSEAELRTLYAKKLGTMITVAELQNIVQDVTNYYRNNGYILTRAILPPQRVHEGIVKIRVIEGYIDEVKVVGNAKGAEKILLAYGQHIEQARPLTMKVLEHYLRLANEVPGVVVRAVLEPSKTNVGASALAMTSEVKSFSGSLSYDDYGTLYVGPLQVTANAAMNSMFRSGDTTHVTAVNTTKGKQLKFFDAGYDMMVGSNGSHVSLDANKSNTAPGFTLTPLKVTGLATSYSTQYTYPLIRSRAQNLTLDASLNSLDSEVFSFSDTLYNDHIRSVKAGGNYDFSDRFNGANLLGLHLSQGLPIFGATNDNTSTTTSRFGGRGVFTKLAAQVARMQPIHGRYSAMFVVSGQYALNPLLSSEQFGFGGSQIGRGYDSSEIIGDRGLSGSVELRMDIAPGIVLMQSLQPYLFYDQGVVWNLKNVANSNMKSSAASAGIGSRFYFTKNLSGNFMLSQPLTKQITAYAVLGRGRLPRGQFSLVASL